MSMSSIRAGITAALSALADSSLVYRAGTTGSWTALTNGVLTTDRPSGIGYSEDEEGESSIQTATLSVPTGAPALAIGAQVRDYSNQVWAVTESLAGVAVTFYRLKRTILSDVATPARQGTER